MNPFTPCIDPATGENFGQSRLHTVDELIESIHLARQAQIEWAKLSIKQRVRHLRPVMNYLVDKADYLAQTISRDNGKTCVDAMATEILPATMSLNYYMKNAGKFLKPKKIPCGNIMMANKRSRLVRVPYGVIGIISPWNYPFGIPFSEVVMALLAGNAVILKTASQTQMVGLQLEACFRADHLPEGLFSFINMPGKEAGTAMLENRIDKIFFTGSVNAGKWLMAKAAETLTPLVLELGGNDPMIVCPDADLNRAAAGAVWGGISNSGQSCAGVERIYVHESVYDPFMKLLKEKIEALRPGYGLNPDSDMGVMTTAEQVETVKKHIEDALAKEAVIFAQSPAPANTNLRFFLPAVVLAGVNHSMLVMRDETFGPVLGVMKVKSMDEAVELANDSELGLTASIWSANRKNAIEIGKKIKAGAVTINDHLMTHGLAETPWGGFKQSGIGRTHGNLGFDEMTQPQVIVNDIMPFVKKNMWWHPYSQTLYDGLKGLIDFLYAKGIGRKMKGLVKVLRIVPRYFKK